VSNLVWHQPPREYHAQVLAEWYSWIVTAVALWSVLFSFYVVSQRRSPASTIAWILILSFLPLAGFIVYYYLGPRRFDRKKRRRAKAQLAVQESGLTPFESLSPKEVEKEEGPANFLIAMNNGALGPSARLRSAALKPYFAGVDKYADLVKDIEAAKVHINMEYYIWEPDKIGTRLRDALTERAKKGVEVRLHLDGVGSAKANKKFWRPLVEAGGQVAHFNRFALRRRSGNFRTHRKIVVIDSTIGYSGGMNITDVHSSEFLGERAWRDTHLRLEGAAVRGLQMVFVEGWYDSTREILEGEKFFVEPGEPDPDLPCVQIVSSGPDENRNAVHKLLATSIFACSKRVYLTTPYFVPDPTTCDALTAAALRGADVRVLVPHKNDLKVIGAASRSYYPLLLDMGVRIFEYGPYMVHSKTLVVDELLAVIGTANADNRSFRLNFEVVVASYEVALCKRLVEAFEEDLEHCEEVTRETLASYGRARRLGQSFARLISPLL
jgi:cardiolipin synthase